ncbi:MAG: oligosaccharide flippase family protein [Methylophilus sp.]
MSDKKNFFVAGFWVILIYGLSQLLRLGSNLIITRLLEPQMFGVMAIVYVIITGIGMFSDLGLWAFIVRSKNPEDPRLLNVIWTMHVVRGWMLFFVIEAVGVCFMIAQNYVPDVFQGVYADTRLPILILVVGVGSIITGYQSMASAVMSRKLQRGKLELIDFVSSVTGVVIMVVWVLLYPTIWALVSAGLVSATMTTVLSYLVFPIRHKLLWDKEIVKDVFDFGKWIVIASMLTYLFMQSDRLFLAGNISASEMGVYSIALMLATTITAITGSLAAKIVFPFLSATVHEKREILKDRYYKIRFYFDGVTFLVVGLIVALAPTIVDVLYDDRYREAGWMLQVLVFSVVGNALSALSLECLSALAITKVNMWVMLIRTVGLFIGLPLIFHLYGLYGAMWVIALNICLPLPVIYWALHKNQLFSFFKEVRMLPLLGVGILLGRGILHFVKI